MPNFNLSSNYDMIDGTARQQRLLQLWKKNAEGMQIFKDSVHKIFSSPIILKEIESPVIDLTQTYKKRFGINLGLSALERIKPTLNFNNIFKSGKAVTISYKSGKCVEFDHQDLLNYFSKSDFIEKDPIWLKDFNRNNILIITGIIYGKNLQIEIESDNEINLTTESELNGALQGKFQINKSSASTIIITDSSDDFTPIAVKSHKLIYSNGEFKNLHLNEGVFSRF